MIRTTHTIKVHSRVDEIIHRQDDFMKAFMDEIGGKALKAARQNVEPGKGPGPHPHRTPHRTPHEDTGDLMRSIEVWSEKEAGRWRTVLFTPIDYGLFLEVGWITSKGNFFRYPWMAPAINTATIGWEQAMVRLTVKHVLRKLKKFSF